MAKCIMIQGTMSNVGKSAIAAGLCRVFKQDGYKVAPFKSQNMALNSFITEEGLEMGRAQVMQAEAAGIKPSVLMNPILLKPTNDVGSQVIVNGEVLGNMSARDYFKYKKKLVPDILAAYHRLEEQADIIVIEGAGSQNNPWHSYSRPLRRSQSPGNQCRWLALTGSDSYSLPVQSLLLLPALPEPAPSQDHSG